jgi:flagellar biosynthesis/type III secretory pathway protein FliH
MDDKINTDDYEQGYRIGKEKAKQLRSDLQQQMARMTQTERDGFLQAIRDAIL